MAQPFHSMLTRYTALWVLPLLAAVAACSSKAVDDSGGRTNWLVACTEDDACESEVCEDGYCTRPCNQDAECEERVVQDIEDLPDATAPSALLDDSGTMQSTDDFASSEAGADGPVALDPAPNDRDAATVPPDVFGSHTADAGVTGYTNAKCLDESAEIVVDVAPVDMAELVVGSWLYCATRGAWGEGEVGFQFSEDGSFYLIKVAIDGTLKYQPAGTWAVGPDSATTSDALNAVIVTDPSGTSGVYLRPRMFRDAATPQWITELGGDEVQVVELR